MRPGFISTTDEQLKQKRGQVKHLAAFVDGLHRSRDRPLDVSVFIHCGMRTIKAEQLVEQLTNVT